MDEVIKRDQNFVTVLAGVTNDSDRDVTMLRVDPITKRLLVKAIGGGGSIGGSIDATQVAFGSGMDTIEGSSNFTFDGTYLALGSGQGFKGQYTNTAHSAYINPDGSAVFGTNGIFSNAGSLTVPGFRLTLTPTSGYVLTSDSSGNGTWQPSSGSGSQTPWTSDIDGGGFDLSNVDVINANYLILPVSGSATNNAIEFGGGSNTGLYSILGTDINIAIQGTYVINIGSTGTVHFSNIFIDGIGTGSLAPSNRLAYSDTGSYVFDWSGSNPNSAPYFFDSANSYNLTGSGAGLTDIAPGSTGDIPYKNASNRFSVSGLSWDSGGSLLSIAGQIKMTGTIYDQSNAISIKPNDRILYSNSINVFDWTSQASNANGAIYWIDSNQSNRLTGDGGGLTNLNVDMAVLKLATGNIYSYNATTPTGTSNISLGAAAGGGASGQYNISIGDSAGNALSTGSYNLMLAVGAGAVTNSGQDNIYLGRNSGISNSTGSFNIALGYNSNEGTTANRCIAIGIQAGLPLDTTTDNQMSIGNLIYGISVDGTGGTISSGNIGIAVKNPGYRLDVSGDINASGIYRVAGSVGQSVTLTFDAITPGACTSQTFSGGILMAYTTL